MNISNDLLLRFDKNYPCWTNSMLRFLNIDLNDIHFFVNNGLLENYDEVYFLSQKGKTIFHELSQENYLPIEPGIFSGSYETEAFRCELKFFIDKKHVQRWGFKEYESPFCVYVPDINNHELYQEVSDKKIIWNYHKTPAFKQLYKDFPHTGIPARNFKAPSMDFISDWFNNYAAFFRKAEFDLIYKCHYDYIDYAGFEPQPGDLWHLFNTSRFVFSIIPNFSNRDFYFKLIGDFQMFLEMQRHIYLPGYTDKDAHDQCVVNCLLFAFPSESEAIYCSDLLKPYSDFLTGPAAPFEIYSISLEALRNFKGNTAEVISDLLPYVSHPISRG